MGYLIEIKIVEELRGNGLPTQVAPNTTHFVYKSKLSNVWILKRLSTGVNNLRTAVEVASFPGHIPNLQITTICHHYLIGFDAGREDGIEDGKDLLRKELKLLLRT